MFGKNKKLMERISQLEKELEMEKAQRARMEAALAEYQTQKAMNGRMFDEIRTAMENRLHELDEKAANFENFKSNEIRKFEEEKRQTLESLKQQELLQQEQLLQEIANNKNNQFSDLERRLQYFNESMNRYLSMVQDMVGVLTTAAFRAGKTVFSDKAEPLADSFQKELETVRTYRPQHDIPTIEDAQTYKLFELYIKARTDEQTPETDR